MKFVIYLQRYLFDLIMGMYINNIYSSDINRHKVDFITKSIKRHYAISNSLKSVNFSYKDVTETSITKQ